jgi:hypothetical protein
MGLLQVDFDTFAAAAAVDPKLRELVDSWLRRLCLDPARPDRMQIVSGRLNVRSVRWDDLGCLVEVYPLDHRFRAYRDGVGAATTWWRVRVDPPPELRALAEAGADE